MTPESLIALGQQQEKEQAGGKPTSAPQFSDGNSTSFDVGTGVFPPLCERSSEPGSVRLRASLI